MPKQNIPTGPSFEEINQLLSHELAQAAIASEPENPYETPQIRQARLQSVIQEELEGREEKLSRGYVAIVEELSKYEKHPFEHFLPNQGKIEKLLKDPVAAVEREGFTGELLGFSQEQLKEFYHACCFLFLQGSYEKCSDAATFLTGIAPNVAAFWLVLGASEQLRKHYTEALHAYDVAVTLDGKNPLTHMYIARCYIERDDKKHAEQALDKVLSLCHNGAHDKLKHDAEQLKRSL